MIQLIYRYDMKIYNEDLPEPSRTATAKFQVSTCQVPEALEFDEEIPAGKSVTFADLCSLTCLSIRCRCWQQDVSWQPAVVAGALDTLQQLVELSADFSQISITDEGCRALGGGVSELVQLITLSLVLRDNNIGDGGCQALGNGLCKLLKLTTLTLDLERNNFGPEGCQALGDELCKLLQLTTLSLVLRENNVGDGGCRALGYS